ncbi:MAG: transcriptional regulator [Planctomycetota bacterium]
MLEASRATSTNSAELPSDMQQLVDAIRSLPTQHAAELAPLMDRVVESTSRRRRILTLVQDALSQLRLDMKYLMFDLEATRRERDEYRERLEEN